MQTRLPAHWPRTSTTFQWQQEDLPRRQSGNSYVPPEQRKWYGSVEHAVSTAAATGSGTGVESAGQLFAQGWLESSAPPPGPCPAHLWPSPPQPTPTHSQFPT